jgi:4-hydroxy-tetrahydrodipicolinate reductase
MKIALLGYGKMGRTIDKITEDGPDEIVLRITSQNATSFDGTLLKESGAEVAIDFSRPETAFINIRTCLEAGVPVVSGTTAWLDQLPEAIRICETQGGALFYASNFSIGVNIFFALNTYLARMMDQQVSYGVRLEEIHHTEKLDAPSGTAITLAEGILEETERYSNWVNEPTQSPDTLEIHSRREPQVPGTHHVTWQSPIDSITISHVANSREGFARGALHAAHWLKDKKGYFTMKDLFAMG